MNHKVFILIILLSASCTRKDPFYFENGGMKSSRIPLIKPYYAYILNEDIGQPWDIHNTPLSDGFSPSLMVATHIDVIIEDSIIIAYNGLKHSEYSNEYFPKWGFFIPNKNVIALFQNEKEFVDSLRFYCSKEIKLRPINDIRKELRDKGFLEWFPEEYKE